MHYLLFLIPIGLIALFLWIFKHVKKDLKILDDLDKKFEDSGKRSQFNINRRGLTNKLYTMNRKIRMQEGDKILGPRKPVINVVGSGVQSHLWIGNDDEEDKGCFATLSGAKRLETLACGILTALGHDAKSIKKRIYEKSSR